MRKIVALFLVLIIMMATSMFSYAGAIDFDGGNGGGGNDSGTVVDREKKEFTTPTAPADGTGEETTASAEETTEPTEETTAPPEVTTVPTEETTSPTEAATEPAVTIEPQPVAASDNQQIIESVLGQKAEQLVEPAANNSGTEGFLLIALIAGLSAICGVLVIRRILDL